MPGFMVGLICFGSIFACNLLLMALVALIRLLPIALPPISRAVWAGLLLTRSLYVHLLTPVAAPVKRGLALDLLQPPWRLAATCLLSFGLGCLVLYMLSWDLSLWPSLVFVAHGLFIGLTWDESFEGGGIQMGERMPWNH